MKGPEYGGVFVMHLNEQEVAYLIDMLRRNRDFYGKVIETSEEKKQAITAGDVAKLDAVVAHEHEILREIAILERERSDRVGEIAERLVIPPESLTVDALAGFVNDEDKRREILILKDELLAKLKIQMNYNEINRKLLESKLEYGEAMIYALSQVDIVGSTYGGDGELTPDGEHTGLFDRQV